MNYEAVLWMQNHKFLYDSAIDLAVDCAAILNLWEKDKYGCHSALPRYIFLEAKKLIKSQHE